MRGKADKAAFPRVFLAATGYFRKTYETLDSEMGERQDTQSPLKVGSVPFKILALAQTNYLWA